MTISTRATVLALDEAQPSIHDDAFVADGARVIGDVTLAASSSVWYNTVLRGDTGSITIGARSNLQDNVSVHVDSGHDTVLGEGISVGHNAVVHGCTIEDECLIGMGAVVLSGAVIGRQSLVAAGAVVLEGAIIPPRSLVAGVPAKVRRELSDEEIAGIIANGDRYVENAGRHARAISA
ncbi:MAG: gamma carbonic anhydrase family protein [Microbacterium sp.]